MNIEQNMMVLIDGSIYGASVCDYAAWVAKRSDLKVTLYHSLGQSDRSSIPADLSGNLKLGARSALLDELAEADAAKARLAHARGRLILENAAERMAQQGLPDTATRLRNEDVLDTLKEFQDSARLVVLGKRGETRSDAFEHLGTNLQIILRNSKKPVLVASRAYREPESYLIAFDGSDAVMKTIARICEGKVLRGLRCTLLHVGTDMPAMRSKIEGAAAELRNSASSVDILFKPGEPIEVIQNTIEALDANLLVIGAYGHRRLRHLFLGSTSAALANSCKVPVIIYG